MIFSNYFHLFLFIFWIPNSSSMYLIILNILISGYCCFLYLRIFVFIGYLSSHMGFLLLLFYMYFNCNAIFSGDSLSVGVSYASVTKVVFMQDFWHFFVDLIDFYETIQFFMFISWFCVFSAFRYLDFITFKVKQPRNEISGLHRWL